MGILHSLVNFGLSSVVISLEVMFAFVLLRSFSKITFNNILLMQGSPYILPATKVSDSSAALQFLAILLFH